MKRFDVYQGKDEVVEQEFKSYGLGERVVLSVMEKHWNQNRKIYFDNYYTSLGLLEQLKTENTLTCGTISARFTKKSTRKRKMKTGDFDFRVSDQGIAFYKWYDNRVVNFASIFFGTDNTIVSRTLKDGKQVRS